MSFRQQRPLLPESPQGNPAHIYHLTPFHHCRHRLTMKIPISRFWGKIKLEKESRALLSWLPLEQHCVDVCLVFRQLVARPLVRRRLEQAAGCQLNKMQLDRLAVLALLHDIGKTNLGFQDKVFNPKGPQPGHVRELRPLFFEESLQVQLMEALHIEELCGWFESPDALQGFLIASLSHHGSPVKFDPSDLTGNYYHAKTRWWRPDESRDPLQAIGHLLSVAQELFPDAFAPNDDPLPKSPRLQHRFAGLVMLSDWLGSHEHFFPHNRLDANNGAETRSAAQRALLKVGLTVDALQADINTRPKRFEHWFDFAPYPLQQQLHTQTCSDPNSHLLIAEAETGSGKTEAAIARFLQLFAAGEVDGLYFALPTRVAAREIYRRIHHTIEKVFPDIENRPVTVLAVPGYARFDNQPIASLLPDDANRWHDDPGQKWQERAWAAEHPKRFLAATVAVGTIDQALLSAIQTRHAYLRSVCLDRQLLVVDEVHASDPYMRRLLTGLLKHHVGIGGHALLLSATLGSVARTEFQEAVGSTVEPMDLASARNAPYPGLSNSAGNWIPLSLPDTDSCGKKVTIEMSPHLWQPESMLPEIRQALANKARVLVVLNTVGRALALQRAAEDDPEIPNSALFQCGGVICPHHGRYSPADREQLDQAISARLGKGSADGPLLLIGTQTLEQSLDIDADLLITDLCPMDVLLQRIGRLWRHQRPTRPDGYPQARCLLLVPENQSLQELIQNDGEATGTAKRAGIGSVYPDLRTMQLTINQLRSEPDREIPKDNRILVEDSTHPEALATLQGDQWLQHGIKVTGTEFAQAIRAQYAALDELYEKDFGSFTFDDIKGEARTPLGMDDLRLPLPEPTTSPFGVMLLEMVIPGHLGGAESRNSEITEQTTHTDGIRFQLGPHRFQYTRLGLERIDEPAD